MITREFLDEMVNEIAKTIGKICKKHHIRPVGAVIIDTVDRETMGHLYIQSSVDHIVGYIPPMYAQADVYYKDED